MTERMTTVAVMAKTPETVIVPVPVDQAAAAMKQAEAVVAPKLRKATAETLRRPHPKWTTGLPGPLADQIEQGHQS